VSVLEVDDLKVEFRVDSGTVKAVNGISFAVEPGRTLAIVGESGSGKSATALSVLRLNPEPPAADTGGEIRFGGRNLLALPEKELRAVRGKGIAMVFQDPMTSLNPVSTVGAQIVEALRRHEPISRADAKVRAVQALKDVGIANPAERAGQYPHQFSGGMRQRVMMAIALACRPQVLIADEPTTALDVTVQAQILELLAELKQKFDMAVVLITHDLGMVAEAADDVLVMYAGRAVERAPVDELFARPLMPYTLALLRSVPRADRPKGAVADPIPGSPPNLLDPPPGCPFEPRCFLAEDRCREVLPPLSARGPNRSAACVLTADEITAQAEVTA
jgi:oligopeptide/dipeptide ABC transporter ATP-binding protein